MKSANSGTPHSYLEVKGLHRLGDAVVGRRRDAVAADALEEAHLRAHGSLVDGRRPARVARARLGSPKAGGCQWRPSGRSFDAGAFTTTRAATRHLVNDATRPLRRGRTRWMPTALGSVIWEFRQEASSQPQQGVAGREEGSAPRTKGSNSRKPDRRFRRGNIALDRPPRATPAPPEKRSPGQLRDLHGQHQNTRKRPRRSRGAHRKRQPPAKPP